MEVLNYFKGKEKLTQGERENLSTSCTILYIYIYIYIYVCMYVCMYVRMCCSSVKLNDRRKHNGKFVFD